MLDVIMLTVIMLTVIMQTIIMLTVIMMTVIMMTVIMLNVIMLSVVRPARESNPKPSEFKARELPLQQGSFTRLVSMCDLQFCRRRPIKMSWYLILMYNLTECYGFGSLKLSLYY
jgi:hypothetical protein